MDPQLLQRLTEAEKGLADKQTWKPNPGDVLAGLILKLREVEGKYGLQTVLEVVSVNDFSVWTVWSPMLLDRALESIEARPGDEIAVKFLGTAADGKTKNYALWLERKGSSASASVGERVTEQTPRQTPHGGNGSAMDREDEIPF